MTSPTPKSRLRRLAFHWASVGVFVLLAGFLLHVHHQAGWEGLQSVGYTALTSLALLGKFVIFSGLHEDTPSIWVLATMVFLLDLLWALALLNGLGSLERAPVLGSWLRRMRSQAKDMIVEFPGLQRMAFIGVFLFVMLPIAATGAITGALCARLLGLSRIAGLTAIATGSASTAIAFALLAQFVGERAEELIDGFVKSPVLVGAILLVAVLLGRNAYRKVIGELKRR